MPRFDPVQSNFTVGEISPKVLGNFELENYKQGLNKAENVIIEPYGGVRRRGGTEYVATVKDSSKDTIVQEFKYKDEFSYILEFGNQYIRFYRNQAQIMGNGSPVEVATTYLEAELRDLRFTQDEDTLYIVHKNHRPAKLTRSSHTSWTLKNLSMLFDYNLGWTERTPSVANNWESICWSPELSLFVAIADSGTGDRVMTSPDGITWTTRTSAADVSWTSICWSVDLTLFCAVASGGTGNGVMTSPDGITWTSRTPATDNNWTDVCWSSELTLFVAIARTGTGDRVMTSPDGITWTTRTSAADESWYGICWSSKLELFVAVASSGAACVMTSPDGITWTVRTPPNASNWRDVCWSSDLELFCAVAVISTPNSIMTSPDGITWTAQTEPATNDPIDICWSSDYGMFVAVGHGTGDKIWYSANGINWFTNPKFTSHLFNSICWSPELGIFCAVGESASIVITSDESLFDMWSANNYPTLCWFFEQRFFLAATPEEPNEIWGSRSTLYTNFDVGTGLDSEAINIIIKEATKLVWVTTSSIILLGANNAEFKLSANNLNEALTPTNIRPVKVTSHGSAFIPAIDVDGGTIFSQRGGRKTRRIDYDIYKDKYSAIDITILASHIFESGLTELVYCNEPDSLIFGVRNDGEIVCIAYEPEYKITAASRFIIGGTDVEVKSIAMSDAVEADEDELWMIVSRTINSATVQYVEFLTQGLTAEDDNEDAFFVDSGVTKTGSDFTTFDGLDHLEGETVQVFADGLIQATKVVASGEITITAADKAHAGLQFISTLETLPIEGGNPIGSAMGKIKRISKTVLRVYKSLKFTISNLLGDTGEDVTLDTSLYTGDSDELNFPGGYETGGQMKIVIDDPIPFSLLAIMYKVRTGE